MSLFPPSTGLLFERTLLHPQNILPLMPQALHVLPTLSAQLLKLYKILLGDVSYAAPATDVLVKDTRGSVGCSRLRVLWLALPPPTFDLSLLDINLEPAVRAAPPLDSFGAEIVQNTLFLDGDPGGGLGTSVAIDIVPGRAEVATDDEDELIGPHEEPRHREQRAGHDARVREVNLGGHRQFFSRRIVVWR